MDKLDKQIIEALKSLKDHPAFGCSHDFAENFKEAARRNGFNPDFKQPHYSWRDYLEYYLYQFTHSMVRPLGAAVSVFVFAITGFISVANASGRALPGDELYGVKLGIEKVQLALAFDADSRANLQVEFASRRLHEMVVLASTVQVEQPESVQLAVERFKSEVTIIKEELQEESGAQEKKELAKALGRQAEVYSSTVASSTTELSDEVRAGVEEVIQETQEQAVEVIITAHEQVQDADTERELALTLEAEIAEVKLEFGDAAALSIEAALVLQAEGNYRRAFQVLKEFVTLSSREVIDEGSH